MSFLDRAADNMDRIAETSDGQPAPQSSFYNIPRIPNTSFFQRNGGVNTNLFSSPPRTFIDKNHSFTIASGSFDLDDDWKQADEWLAQMTDSDDEEPQVSGVFGFRFHHSHLDKGSDMEEEDVPVQFRKGKGKTREKVVSKSFTYGQLPIITKKTVSSRSRDTEKGKALNRLNAPSQFQSFPYRAPAQPTTNLALRAPPIAALASVSFDRGVGYRRRMAISSIADVAQAQPALPTFMPSTTSSQSETVAASSIGQTTASTSFPLWHPKQAAQAVQEKDEDEDMPDTDVESWGEGEE